jgi:lipid-binding SYLF domain-containing protein
MLGVARHEKEFRMRQVFQTAFAFCLLCLAPAATAWDYDAATKAQINLKVDAALSNLYASVPGSRDVISNAAGVLVFPRAGFMAGGKHGGGALQVGGKKIGYYRTDRMTYSVRPAAEDHAVVIAFMTQDALKRIQTSDDWDVGSDPSVAVVTAVPGGKIETSQLDKPVELFAFGDKGLMGPVTLQGAKVTRVH